MNRRGFLGLFTAGVAGIALEQAIPLGRVWSFPSKIVPAFAGLDLAATGLDLTVVWERDLLTGGLKVGDMFTVAAVNAVKPERLYTVIQVGRPELRRCSS
jgi:hypothetical protein